MNRGVRRSVNTALPVSHICFSPSLSFSPSPCLSQIAAHFKENEIDSFIEVMNQYFNPNKTRWADVAAVCEKAGFMDMSDALLGAMTQVGVCL